MAGAAVPASMGDAEAEAVSVTCTNPYSGATWRIAIDYDLKTVDANPASIDETQIWWRDGKDGWRYTLDRKSGALTVVWPRRPGETFSSISAGCRKSSDRRRSGAGRQER